MPESYYNPAQSPEYTVQIRRLQNSDPGNAEEVFNPLFQKLVDNIHANHLYKADLVNGKVPEAQLPDMDYIGRGEKGEANGVAPRGADGEGAGYIPQCPRWASCAGSSAGECEARVD